MKLGLILSVYNRADFLDPVLCSIARQTILPQEVVVSEDGDSPAMAEVVGRWRSRWPSRSRLRHVTQEDRGNRKPRAMNRAIASTDCDYLIFVDGDCVLRRDFVEDHVALKESGAFLTGRRVDLSLRASRWVNASSVALGLVDGVPWRLLVDALWGQTRHVGQLFRVPRFFRRLLGLDRVLDIRACNLSAFRSDLEKVNGFDNGFSGAYGEDSDLEYRLRFAGVRMKGIRGAAIQYHLWHPTQAHDPANQMKLEELRKRRSSWAIDGLAQVGHPGVEIAVRGEPPLLESFEVRPNDR